MTEQPEKAGDYPINIINEGLVAEIEHLRAQRDQLLAALKQLDQMFDFEGGFPSCECFLDPTEVNAVCEMARAAIAKGGEHA